MNYKTILLCAVLGASMQTAHGMDGKYSPLHSIQKVHGMDGRNSPLNSIRQYQSTNSLLYANANNNNQAMNTEQNTNNNNNNNLPPHNPPPPYANASGSDADKIVAALNAINKNLELLTHLQQQQVNAQNDTIEMMRNMFNRHHSNSVGVHERDEEWWKDEGNRWYIRKQDLQKSKDGLEDNKKE